jgi:hypothetical protein
MTKEILEQWLDYRIKIYEMERKHSRLGWGKYNDDRQERDYCISACGIQHDKQIQLYISQYCTYTAMQVLEEIINMLDVAVTDYDIEGYKQFKYKGYTFFMSVEYSEESIKRREHYGLEV